MELADAERRIPANYIVVVLEQHPRAKSHAMKSFPVSLLALLSVSASAADKKPDPPSVPYIVCAAYADAMVAADRARGF